MATSIATFQAILKLCATKNLFKPFLPLQKIGKKFFGPTSPELIGKKLYLSPTPVCATAIVLNVPGGKLGLPLGVFDEFNFCILQVLNSNLFKDFQFTIKIAAILQEEFVF